MKVQYIGPYAAVDVPRPGSITGASTRVERGEWLETSDEHALSLAEQESWALEPAPVKKSAQARDKAANPSEEDA